jgi:hypothetical protein
VRITTEIRKSADVNDPLFSPRLRGSGGLRGKLERRRFLTLKHISEQQRLPIRKL